MTAILLVDLTDAQGYLIAGEGTLFTYNENSDYQRIKGKLIFVDTSEYELI